MNVESSTDIKVGANRSLIAHQLLPLMRYAPSHDGMGIRQAAAGRFAHK